MIISDNGTIDNVIKKLNAYSRGLERKAKMLCERLAADGYTIASAQFGSALYDGTNDVSVELLNDGEKMVIKASGEAVLFIEFGTGVRNAEHPMQHDVPGIVGHGQYGHGLGRLESWRYPESKGQGTGGEKDPDHPGYYITHGNPANMAMYNASKDMRRELEKVAQEVFRS